MDPHPPSSNPATIPATSPIATYALVGWPLGFSLSPAMHNAAFAALGIAARYVLLPTVRDDLPGVFDALRAGALSGANITVPHKVHARRLLDDESDLATAIGAVNTIVRGPDGLRGENTDPAGFSRALEGVDMPNGRGKRAIVLGAGGAARAVVHVLLAVGYSATILSRSTSQSGVLAAQLYRAYPGARLATAPLIPEVIATTAARADLLVNATPVGSASTTCDRPEPKGMLAPEPSRAHAATLPDEHPASLHRRTPVSLWPIDRPLPAHLTVIDLVAWPPETALVAQARAAGARAIGGFEMLLGQAAEAFTLWTGQPAPVDIMRSAGLISTPDYTPSPKTAGGGGRGAGAGARDKLPTPPA